MLHSLEERIGDAVRAVGQRSGSGIAHAKAKRGETTLTALMEQTVARVKETDKEVVQVTQDIAGSSRRRSSSRRAPRC